MTLAIKFRCYFADGASPRWIYCSAATYEVKRQIFDRFCDNYIMAPMLCLYKKNQKYIKCITYHLLAYFAYWVILHAFFLQNQLFRKILSGIIDYHQSVKQFGPRPGPTFCLFCKVDQQMTSVGKSLSNFW